MASPLRFGAACSLALLMACGDDEPSAPAAGGGGVGASTGPTGGTLPAGGEGGALGGEGGGGALGGRGGEGGSTLPRSFDVSVRVVDGDGEPVEGALVMQGGLAAQGQTPADGTFDATMDSTLPGTPAVIAAKQGYRTAGVDIYRVPTAPMELVLYEVKLPDNEAYEFGHPGWGDPQLDVNTSYCGHCHTTYAAQFQSSGHARATRNDKTQSLYAGITLAFTDAASCNAGGGTWRSGIVPGQPGNAQMKCYLDRGVLPDLNPSCPTAGGVACDDPAIGAGDAPTSFGGCADCHALAMQGPAGGRDLHEAEGIAYEFGNHCDGCHKIADVTLGGAAGLGGNIRLQRPIEALPNNPITPFRQAMFGPLPDVANAFMGGVYQPLFLEAELCAGCHLQYQPALLPGEQLDPLRWPNGLPTHSTYEEWLAGPYPAADVVCQDCHMPPILGLVSSVDVTTSELTSTVFGFARTPEQLRSHQFVGPLGPATPLIDNAATVALSGSSDGSALTVDARVINTNCGHALPTGEPMRQAMLWLEVEACGQTLSAIDGPTILDLGGYAATGLVGVDVTALGASLTWSGLAPGTVAPGAVVRVVRPTGGFIDYPGIGFFADAGLTPADKGMPLEVPVGRATIVSVAGDTLTLSQSLQVQNGDRVYIGDPLALPTAFELPARALAGAPGMMYARVLVDAQGSRGVPHYRAVDIASDNRLPPMVEVSSTHVFDHASIAGCSQAVVTAALIYRPHDLGTARAYGWDAKDYEITQRTWTVALP